MSQRVIPQDGLSAGQRATLSNTICADVGCGQDLERMGLVTIRRVGDTADGAVAFFDLTMLGEEFVTRHYVVPETSTRG